MAFSVFFFTSQPVGGALVELQPFFITGKCSQPQEIKFWSCMQNVVSFEVWKKVENGVQIFLEKSLYFEGPLEKKEAFLTMLLITKGHEGLAYVIIRFQ